MKLTNCVTSVHILGLSCCCLSLKLVLPSPAQFLLTIHAFYPAEMGLIERLDTSVKSSKNSMLDVGSKKRVLLPLQQ